MRAVCVYVCEAMRGPDLTCMPVLSVHYAYWCALYAQGYADLSSAQRTDQTTHHKSS